MNEPDRDSVIRALRDTNSRLQAFARIDADLLKQRYREGSWTGVQLISHIADTDVMFYGRFLLTAAGERNSIVPFDQDVFVRELGGDHRPVGVSLQLIDAVRHSFMYHVQILSDEALAREASHPEWDRAFTALEMAQLVAKHSQHHLGQLDALRDGREWSPEDSVSYRE